MYGLQEEVSNLNNCLSQNSVSVQAIKKAYQIDADRLQICYKDMLDKYRSLSETMKVEISINYDQFLKGLEQSIQIRVGGQTGNSRVSDERSGIIRVDEEK